MDSETLWWINTIHCWFNLSIGCSNTKNQQPCPLSLYYCHTYLLTYLFTEQKRHDSGARWNVNRVAKFIQFTLRVERMFEQMGRELIWNHKHHVVAPKSVGASWPLRCLTCQWCKKRLFGSSSGDHELSHIKTHSVTWNCSSAVL